MLAAHASCAMRRPTHTHSVWQTEAALNHSAASGAQHDIKLAIKEHGAAVIVAMAEAHQSK